jgi:uncharacterized repeat protein (TIGR01451 family)
VKKAFAVALALAAAVGIAPQPVAAQLPARLVTVVDDVVDPVVRPAYEVEYAVQVVNPSTAPISGIAITAETPEGTYFGEASTTAGTIEAPPQGQRGRMVVAVGTLEPGASARVRFELGLEAGAGSQLFFSATVTNSASAPEEIAETTFLVDRGDPILRWGGIFPFGPNPTVAPTMLRVERPVEPMFRHVLFPLSGALAGAEYRIYRSATPEVVLIEANLVATLPSTQLNTGTLTEPGFYVVTAVRDGVESEPSNVVSFGMGEPAVERVTIKGGVLKAQGSGFDETVEVTVDGLTFSQPARVKRGATRVTQTGRLSNGETVSKYLKVRPSALVCFRNANGSVACWLYTGIRFEQ